MYLNFCFGARNLLIRRPSEGLEPLFARLLPAKIRKKNEKLPFDEKNFDDWALNSKLFIIFAPRKERKRENKVKIMGHLLTFWNNYIRRYKYVVAFLVFMLIIGVVDENSLLVRYHRRVDISNLKREIDKYQQQYDEESARLQSLMNNPAAVEKLARETYLMKRAEEDVFVIVDSTSTD